MDLTKLIKREIMITIGTILLISTIFIGVTYAVYMAISEEDIGTIAFGDITFSMCNNASCSEVSNLGTVISGELHPMNETEALELTPYSFVATNSGDEDIYLTVYATTFNDNDYDYSKVQLATKLSTEENYTKVKFSSQVTTIKERILIPSGTSKIINILVWGSEELSNEMIGKTFHTLVNAIGYYYPDDGEEITYMPNIDPELTRGVNFTYTGSYQEWEVPLSGYYLVEAWGAQGGFATAVNPGNHSGLGGYASGKTYLSKGEKLYIYVGNSPVDVNSNVFNGGGVSNSDGRYASGGGSTDIRYFGTSNPSNTDLTNELSTMGLNSRIMVAGGGGGGYVMPLIGGYGGGLQGGSGLTTDSALTSVGSGGSQIAGGIAGVGELANGTNGSFGLGGLGNSYQSGGGGGYYGGSGSAISNTAAGTGAGGSSFISGYAGSNSILDTVDLTNVRYIKDCTNGSTIDLGNVWVEIQALVNGTNVALNKIVTGPTTNPYVGDGTGTWSSIVDGNAAALNYVYGTTYTGNQCVIVDLQNEYDLDEIKVWHYWGDGRTYYNNITYVASTNTASTIWIPVKSTTEAETSAGKSIVDGTVNSATAREHTNNTLHYSRKYFIDGEMSAGNNSGNGKAKVTYLGISPERKNTKLNNVRYIKDCSNGNTVNSANLWVEIQALVNGTNVALNKTVTGPTTNPYTGDGTEKWSSIVDGNVAALNYVYGTTYTGNQCAIVDLGENPNSQDGLWDLDEVAVWHYWGDGRTYNSNTTYVASTNTANTEWIPIKSTTEPETSQGKRVTAWD